MNDAANVAAKIAEAGIGQRHGCGDGNDVELLVGGWIQAQDVKSLSALRLNIRILSPDMDEVSSLDIGISPFAGGSFSAAVVLENPLLWWVAGLGERNFYTVALTLTGTDGHPVDSMTRRIGIRTLDCVERKDGTRAMRCNGTEFFARGAIFDFNAATGYETVLSASCEAHFNALRLGDGGEMPPEDFFSACDEAGIAVLGVAGAGSGGDAALCHPCVPDDPLREPDDDTGFETMRSVVSFAAPQTLQRVAPGMIEALNGLEAESRIELRGGMSTLASAVLASFPLPKTQSGWIWMSQLAQAAEAHRRIAAARESFVQSSFGRQERSATGFFAAAAISSQAGADAAPVDSDGVWKALQYELTRAFAPETVVATRPQGENAPVVLRFVDERHEAHGSLFEWRLTTTDGATVVSGCEHLDPGFSGVERLKMPDFSPFIAEIGAENLLLWVALKDSDGCVIARSSATFVPPRLARLQNPGLAVDVSQLEDTGGEQVFRLGISASAPALGVFVETPSIASVMEDSFFDLEPDETVEVHVATLERVSEARFRASIRVFSLFDL